MCTAFSELGSDVFHKYEELFPHTSNLLHELTIETDHLVPSRQTRSDVNLNPANTQTLYHSHLIPGDYVVAVDKVVEKIC